MTAETTARLVTDALVMAIRRRAKPDALLHQSDRGGRYAGEPLQRLRADAGVSCAMSRAGNLRDRATEDASGPSPVARSAMARVFASPKTERLGRQQAVPLNRGKSNGLVPRPTPRPFACGPAIAASPTGLGGSDKLRYSSRHCLMLLDRR